MTMVSSIAMFPDSLLVKIPPEHRDLVKSTFIESGTYEGLFLLWVASGYSSYVEKGIFDYVLDHIITLVKKGEENYSIKQFLDHYGATTFLDFMWIEESDFRSPLNSNPTCAEA